MRRPRIDASEPRDLLILAAHPDDCVIMAGEYALDALHAKRHVRVLYLTSGADSPDEPRAEVRKLEAISAWQLAGLTKESLEFANLPQSPVEGPSVWTPTHRDQAAKQITSALSRLPQNAAVFIPAAGELHCDHRELRKLALESHSQANRPDLLLLETPEYNPYHAFAHQPHRGLHFVAQTLPFVSRILNSGNPNLRAGFISGPLGSIRKPDNQRLAQKQSMLRQFHSEDGAALVKYFGHPDLYRTIPLSPNSATNSELSAPFLRFGDKFICPFVLCLCLVLWSGIFLAGSTIIWLASHHLTHSAVLALMGAALIALLVGMFRPVALERKLTFAALACGFLTGLAS